MSVYKLVFHFKMPKYSLLYYYYCTATFELIYVPPRLYPVGLRTAADDLQSLCRIYTQVTCQEEEDALFLWRHHSRGEERVCYALLINTTSTFLNIKIMNLHAVHRWCLVIVSGCFSKVHGLAHTLHSLGHPDNPACKVHQWCTEKTRRRRGGTLF